MYNVCTGWLASDGDLKKFHKLKQRLNCSYLSEIGSSVKGEIIPGIVARLAENTEPGESCCFVTTE